jgi:hypothetical protein
MNDLLERATWTCKLCEASGDGGYVNYYKHYENDHKSLERERYRVI